MNIKIIYTATGPIIGDMNEDLEGFIVVTNPAMLIMQPQNVMLMPLLAMCEERSIRINRSDIQFNGEMFTPVTEVRNHYSSQFGSGIQLPG